MVPPEPDATQLTPSGADTPTIMGPPSQVPSGTDAPTILNTPETMMSGGSHGSSVSRPISASLSSSRAAASTPGIKRIGDYDLESEIARGGMGIVYKARQLSLNRPVAFKMILAGQFASAADVDRFHVEAEAAAGLDHPNIVPIYEVGAFEGNHFFTMKFVDGRSMAQDMPRLVKAPRDGVRLLVKVCRAIHYAHQHSILHRDLKPANILLDGQSEPHVTDFGLAKRTGGDSQLTQTGMIVGTPSYMAPEQAAPSKTPLTTAADVYSLGAILYEILTGRPPFKGNSPLDTVMLVLNKEAERPRSINATADRDLETIALKCLEKDPARRYGSAEALAEDLDRWINHEPILARPIGTAERVAKWARRRPAIAALAVAMTAVTVLGVAGVIWQWREAVFQRGQTAEALIQLAATAHETELARDKEAAQRAAAQAAQAQEEIHRKAADEQKAIAVNALGDAERNLYFNNIDLADREWSANNIGHVDQLLASSPGARRNWEWNYLSRLAHMETRAIPAPGGNVIAMAVSPDGARMTTVGADLSTAVWDLKTHRQLRAGKLDGLPGMGYGSSALSADGSIFMASIQRLTNGAISEENRVWDTATGKSLWNLPATKLAQTFASYMAVALDGTGTKLATSSVELNVPTDTRVLTPEQVQGAAAQIMNQAGSRIQVWDARSGKELVSPAVVAGRISTMSMSADGSQLVIGSRASSALGAPSDLKVLDIATGKIVATLNQSAGANAVFSRDGRTIAASVSTGLRLWPVTGGDERWSWIGKSSGAPAFSPSGRFVATALSDRSIQVLDAATGREVTRFTGSTAPVTFLAFTGADSEVLSTDAATLRFFSVREAPSARIAEGAAATATSAGVTPDHRRLIVNFSNGAMKSWDLETGRELFGWASSTQLAASPLILMSQASQLNSRVFFSGDGQRTARASSMLVDTGSGPAQMRHALQFLDTQTGAEIWRVREAGDGREVKQGELLKALQSGAAMSMGMGFALDESGTHAALATMRMSIAVPAPAAGGAATASRTADAARVDGSRISLWTAPGERPTATIDLKNTMVVSVELSPDGRRAVALAGGYSNAGPVAAEYRVYDVATGRLVKAFQGAKEAAPIAFSRDGNFIAAETARNTVTVWDLREPGRPVFLPEHASAVTKLAFSPDGTRLASLAGQSITLFDARSGNQLLVLRDSNGPFSVREFIVPGKLAGNVTTLNFSRDGRQILQTTISNDARGIKVQSKTWDGSPLTKR